MYLATGMYNTKLAATMYYTTYKVALFLLNLLLCVTHQLLAMSQGHFQIFSAKSKGSNIRNEYGNLEIKQARSSMREIIT